MLTFQDLYENYAVDVYRFSVWVCGDKVEAEDIASDTFIRAWAKRNTIRTETLKAYLFTIARNIYLEKQRKQHRSDDLSLNLPDPSPGPEEIFDHRLDLAIVQQTLQLLPEIDRTAFVLRIEHEMPYAEIARVLEISLSAAKVKVHRVRKRILIVFLEKEDKE